MNPVLKEKSSAFFSKLLIYIVIIYTFFLLGKAVWTNYQLKKQTDNLEVSILQIQKQNKDLENLILYYQSDSFREVEARRKLGLKKPDEKMVLVPVKKYDNFNDEVEATKENISQNQQEEKQPNWELWWQYFAK
jgi:cell division protein FtsB